MRIYPRKHTAGVLTFNSLIDYNNILKVAATPAKAAAAPTSATKAKGEKGFHAGDIFVI